MCTKCGISSIKCYSSNLNLELRDVCCLSSNAVQVTWRTSRTNSSRYDTKESCNRRCDVGTITSVICAITTVISNCIVSNLRPNSLRVSSYRDITHNLTADISSVVVNLYRFIFFTSQVCRTNIGLCSIVSSIITTKLYVICNCFNNDLGITNALRNIWVCKSRIIRIIDHSAICSCSNEIGVKSDQSCCISNSMIVPSTQWIRTSTSC